LIFVDTNVVSEHLRRHPDEAVQAWIERFEVELALPTVTIAEIAFGISRVPRDERSFRLGLGLDEWRRRLSGRIFSFTEDAAIAYGELMGTASRDGREMSVPDGMIAAIAQSNGGKLATRNLRHFEGCGLSLINPWEF
jgi:predicted nucleic acid-binding protein